MQPRPKQAFTLIELLVVIAILAILAAILFPVFATAREKARQAGCAANCKQMIVAVLLYSDDFDERLALNLNDSTTPFADHERTWGHLTYPYLRNTQLFRCPSDSGTTRTPNIAGNWVQLPYGSYSYSEWMSGRALSEIEVPAELFVLMDGRSPWSDTCQNAGRLCFRHHQGGNFAHADGHVKWRRSRTPRPEEWWPDQLGFYGTPVRCNMYPTTWSAWSRSACLP